MTRFDSKVERLERRDLIVDQVTKNLDVERKDIFAPNRCLARIATARQVAMYFCSKYLPGASMTEIGDLFGRDRTTVRHALYKIHAQRTKNPSIEERLLEIQSKIESRLDEHPASFV